MHIFWASPEPLECTVLSLSCEVLVVVRLEASSTVLSRGSKAPRGIGCGELAD